MPAKGCPKRKLRRSAKEKTEGGVAVSKDIIGISVGPGGVRGGGGRG